MNGIFDSFRNSARGRDGGAAVPSGDIFFRICFGLDGRAVLKVTDAKGKETNPDYRHYSGDTFLLLRSLAAIKTASASTFSWTSVGNEIKIDEHPQLMPRILKCQNLADDTGTALKALDGLYQIHIDIQESGRTTVVPVHSLERLEGDGPAFISEFRLILDNYALCGDKIVRLKPVGEEYLKLESLNGTFSKDVEEQYLSILMSNFDNIRLTVGGKKTVAAESPAKVVPAIVFEKVDDSNALFIRLTETIPGETVEFVEDFSPTRLVSILPDGTASVRKVEYPLKPASPSTLYKRITACAPDKKSAKEVYQNGRLFIIPEETAGPFLLHNLSALTQEYVLIGSDKLVEYKIRPVQPKLTFKGSSGIDFLEGSAEIKIGEDIFSIFDFLAQYRKSHYIELSNGEKGVVDEAYMRKIENLFGKHKKGGKNRLSFFDLPEAASLMEKVPDSGLFRKSLDFFLGFNKLATSPELNVNGLNAQLRPYQQNGVKWLKYLYDNNLGGCLADDMGLGKTVQAISLLLLADRNKGKTKDKDKDKPSLIVMPRTLLFNWKSEFGKFAPQMSVYTYHGTERNPDEARRHQVILTTYAIIRNDIEEFSKIDFHCVILDESQNIKNISAKASQAVMLLKAEHRFALSGTPVENRLEELYSLFRFLNPGMFGSLEDFNEKYISPIQKNSDKFVMQQLRSRISPYLLRRTKEEVLNDLPERIDQTIKVEMEPAHASFYEMRRRHYYDAIKNNIRAAGMAKSQFEILQALNELRRIASVPESLSDGKVRSSKIPVIAEAVLEAVENGHKVVVFFNFIAGIELLGEELAKEHVGYVVMTGATSDRESVIDRFQNDPECSVLLMTLKTGGVGLNLTAADTVFIAEPWWNSSAQEQAIGRLHRIGQKSVVHSFSVITAGSIEEKILQLQQQKTALVEALISSDSSTSKVLTEEDIDFILG